MDFYFILSILGALTVGIVLIILGLDALNNLGYFKKKTTDKK